MTTSWVISIDFGTASSCYCYCFRENASDLICPPWINGGVVTPKTPTCILFDEQKEFMDFGYEALNEYMAMGQNKKYFFNDFKMLLYNRRPEDWGPNMMIIDSGGKEMEAMTVFSESLRYLKDHAVNMISSHTTERTFSASDVTWVVTVPTIWDPRAKQFMREAATEGGLISDTASSKLIIALEPEAASLFCKQLSSNGFIPKEDEKKKLENIIGTQYIVVDCGGGTVDMTVHEVMGDRRLKELHKAQGNDMGGATVDAEFKKFLQNTFGDVIWKEYENKFPSEMQAMMSDFKTSKCEPLKEGIKILCRRNLHKLAGGDYMKRFFTNVKDVSLSPDDEIHISLSKLEEFFKKSVDKIVDAIRAIVHYRGLKIRFIILVGGYSTSKILRDEVKRQFSTNERTIICPMDAHVAVAKGAVLYGLNPMIVASRVSARTYGIAVARPFDKKLHREGKKIVNKAGDVYCDNLFYKFVENGQSVECDHIAEYKFGPFYSDQTAMTFQFFCTEAMYVDENLKAMYVDDMERIGQFTVNMPDIRGGLERKVTFEIGFGLTEIRASAIDQTSKQRDSVRLEFDTK